LVSGSTAKALIDTREDGSSVVTAEALLVGGALPSLKNSGTGEMTVIANGAFEVEWQRRCLLLS
jgi:hypothetical protein